MAKSHSGTIVTSSTATVPLVVDPLWMIPYAAELMMIKIIDLIETKRKIPNIKSHKCHTVHIYHVYIY